MTLVCVASRGVDDRVLAEHIETCQRCNQRIEELATRADVMDRAQRLEDCDHAVLLMNEAESKSLDAAPLAALVAHLRTCSMCYQRMALASFDREQIYLARRPADPPADGLAAIPAERFEFQGTERFQIRQRIGSGAMGVVYEAHDVEAGMPVALKALRHLSGKALLRFKNEFRARQDLSHENLISLGELIEHGGQWFFTMELVHGQDFIRYVRDDGSDASSDDGGSVLSFDTSRVDMQPTREGPHHESVLTVVPAIGDRCNLVRLSSALIQLCSALRALHEAGKIHRDIKPSNILVTRAGRLVVLDFGLVSDLTGPESTHNRAVGTPAYMAPEQATGAQVGPAADLYSVGVLLYEALTGRRPFSGSYLELYWNKRWQIPLRPRQLAPETPAGLDELCMQLLSFTPERRPIIDEILACIQSDAEAGLAASTSGNRLAVMAPSLFVGRTRELAALDAALAESRDVARAGAVTVVVHGGPGLGKTTLANHFAAEVRSSLEHAAVLVGRCYQRESVPYKGFDKVIDALSRYLSRLPPEEAASLLPRRARILADVFPVLRRVEAIVTAPAVSRTPAGDDGRDGRDGRSVEQSQVFGALRELLARIADRRPLVIVIDDLHWADHDSLELVSAILAPPGAPAMLLVATADSDEERHLIDRLPGVVRALPLSNLTADDALALARALLTRRGQDSSLAEILARETRGHPALLGDLVSEASHAGQGSQAGQDSTLTLSRALARRLGALDVTARRMLELVALARRPVPVAVACRAVGIDAGGGERRVTLLVAEHLAYTTGQPPALAPYHHSVRAAVRAGLGPDEQRTGQLVLAQALAESGHGHEAAAEFRAAASRLGPAQATLLAVRAAQALVYAGKLDDGLVALERALDAFAPASVTSPRGAVLARLARRAWGRLRGDAAASAGQQDQAGQARRRARAGKDDPAPRDDQAGADDHAPVESVPPAALEALWHAAATLAVIDPERSRQAFARQHELAARASDPLHLARALVHRAARAALAGKDRQHVLATLETASQKASHIGQAGQASQASSAELMGLVASARALLALCTGDWQQAIRHGSEADALLPLWSGALSVARNANHHHHISALFYAGEIGSLGSLADQLERADRRRPARDWQLTVLLDAGLASLRWLAADDLARARQASGDGLAAWPRSASFTLLHKDVFLARQHLHLYAGDAHAAWREIQATWPAVERSPLFQYPHFRVECLAARGRAALAEACRRERVLLDQCERDARQLERDSVPHAAGLAELLRAGAARARGDLGSAQAALERAVVRFDSAAMPLHAAAARRCFGMQISGDSGKALVAAADQVMSEKGIAGPALFTAMLAPGLASA